MRKGLQPSRARGHPTTMGCSTRYGGGELTTFSLGLAREGLGVPSLLVNRPISRTQSLLRPSSAQPTVESGRRLHAASRRAVAFGALPSGRLVLSGRRCRWCGVARCLLSPGRARAVACRALRRRRAGSGGQRNGTGSPSQEGPSCRRGRGSDARGSARASLMLLQKSTDSARRREADVHHFTRFGERSGTGA
jgi:hypothetical protein